MFLFAFSTSVWCICELTPKQSAVFWLGREFWRHSHRVEGDAGVDARLMMHPRRQGVGILVVYFEDLVRDLRHTSRVLFAFLKVYLGDAVPEVETSVLCALAAAERESAERRHHSSSTVDKFLTFPAQERRLICDALQDAWAQEKWGPCMGQEGGSQVEASLPPVMPFEIPKEKCGDE